MGSTTTLKLPEELKTRIAPLAKSAAKTPHAWMVEALETQARLAEKRLSFINDALASAAEVDAGGKVYEADEVFGYIQALAAGKPANRPKPVTRPAAKKTKRPAR